MNSRIAKLSQPSSCLVISLDFELMWGVCSDRTVAEYGDAVMGARAAIPEILRLFARHDIRATWATVGFLFFDSKTQLCKALPAVRPEYAEPKYSPYPLIDHVGRDEASDPLHYGRSLLGRIAETPGQEIATHTFSHFFCREPGPSLAAFGEDVAAARNAADEFGVRLRSIVFPRDQWARPHVEICAAAGITAFRGSLENHIYRPMARGERNLTVRALRGADALLSTGIDTTHPLPTDEQIGSGPQAALNVPASRFFRSAMDKWPGMSELHLRRILAEMEHAAKNGRMYHLWWHPHNFGRRQDRALAMLSAILTRFAALRERYGMQSTAMGDWLDLIAAASAAAPCDATMSGSVIR